MWRTTGQLAHSSTAKIYFSGPNAWRSLRASRANDADRLQSEAKLT